MKHILLLTMLLAFHSVQSHADELVFNNKKSIALVEDLKSDISESLSRISELESDADNHEWQLVLSKPGNTTQGLGVVIEPSTQRVLSVPANSLGRSIGILPGDIIKSIKLNNKPVASNITETRFKKNDYLVIGLIRNDKKLQLDANVKPRYIPSWKLYVKSEGDFEGDDSVFMEITGNTQSETSEVYLNRLQDLISSKLHEISKNESVVEEEPFELRLTNNAQASLKLGIAMDQNSKTVISVDEGSFADKLGLQADDVIKSITVDNEFHDGNLSSITLKEGIDLSFEILRENNQLHLGSKLKSRKVPAWHLAVNEVNNDNSCGVVSFLINPSIPKDIYKVEATKLNGDTVISSKVIYELEPGYYEFKLYDKIPISEITRMIRVKRLFSRPSKTLGIKVEPNKRYYLAAKLDRDNRYKRRDGKYWEPVILKVEDYECSLD